MNDSTDRWAGVLQEAAWRKSSFSVGGECVSFAEVDQDVVLRNSNAPEAGALLLERRAITRWIAGIKIGEFDDLTA